MKTTTPDTRAAILNLLGITHDTYSTTVEQLGYGFAWHYTQHNEWSVNYLTKAAAYWKQRLKFCHRLLVGQAL